MSGVNEQGFLCTRRGKDIWNYKKNRGLENCKNYLLMPFRTSIFAKNVVKNHGTYPYEVLQCKKRLFKKSLFDGICATYFSINQLSAE